MTEERVLSPTDYAAWSKGYMPPSEHILIDELSFHGATVMASSSDLSGNGVSWWLVTKGGGRGEHTSRIGLAVHQLMAEWEIETIRALRKPKQPPWLPEDLAAQLDTGRIGPAETPGTPQVTDGDG